MLRNQSCLLFHQGNTRPNAYLTNWKELLELGWHFQLSFLPALIFPLISIITSYSEERKFSSSVKVKNHIDKFFIVNLLRFWQVGFFKFTEKIEKIFGTESYALNQIYINIGIFCDSFFLISTNFLSNTKYKRLTSHIMIIIF